MQACFCLQYLVLLSPAVEAEGGATYHHLLLDTMPIEKMTLATAIIISVALFQSSLLSCDALIILPQGSKQRNLHGTSAGLSNTFHRHNIIRASSLNSVSDTTDSPILRGLYDPLPRIDCNGTVVNEGDKTEIPQWVNKVTSGTMATEEGSPHELYFEVHHRLPFNSTARLQSGLVGLVLHGGPGAGCFPKHTQFFSTDLYEYVVLFDQRGCGRSTPLGEVKFNRLELLVDDIERLKHHLTKEGLIDKWVVDEDENKQLIQSTKEQNRNHHSWDVILGGSWGCTLAMAYAFTHPKSVRAMVLRGVCLFRKKEIDWLFGNPPSSSVVTPRSTGGSKTSNLRDLVISGSSGRSSVSVTAPRTALERQSVAAQLFTEQWKEFSSGVEHAENDKRSVLHSYYHRLLGTDANSRFQAMRSWFRWEMGIYGNGFKKKSEGSNEDENRLLVWNPLTSSWMFEDARVHNRDSIDSVHVEENSSSDYGTVLQSLRRFSSTSSYTSSETDERILEPLPIEEIPEAGTTDSKVDVNVKGNKTSFDPTTYIPAQAMLTCYYSVNGDYCIHPYNSFLSLNPPPSVPLSSWFSSELPPSSSKSYESSISSGLKFPLPPTIAIQGGNDAICPADTALDLHNAWKQLEVRIALESGHSMYDPVISGEIVKALERFGRSLITDRGGSDYDYGR